MKRFSGLSATDKTGILIFILASFLFLYVCVRAYFLAITWDEAYSYLQFIRKGFFSPFYVNGVSANNHLLNTWLSYLTSALFGVSEFTLRIPNVSGYFLFLFFTAKICNRFSSSFLRISSFLILNLNPYLIDFFSLSRGYGLSYGFLAGSIWYLYQFLKNDFGNKYSLLSLVFVMAAVFAYLTLIHFAIALFIIIFLIDLLFAGKPGFLKRFLFSLKKNRVAAVLFLIFLAIIIPRIIGLKNADALFYGGKTGFWQDTVLTVFEQSLYGKPYPGFLKYILTGIALLISFIALSVSLKIMYKKNILCGAYILPVLSFLFFYCALISVLQHYAFQTPYLTNRTALFLLVLFSFMFVFLLNEAVSKIKIFGYALPLIGILLIVHFYNCFNLKYVFEYNLNADSKEMIRDIESFKKETPPEKFCTDAGLSYHFLEPINFYRCIYNFSWLGAADKFKMKDPFNDFYLFTENEFKEIHNDSFIVIKKYPLFNNILLKRKFNPGHREICFSAKQDFESAAGSMPLAHARSDKIYYSGKTSGYTDEKNEYSDELSYRIDLSKTPAKNSMVLVKAMIWMEKLNNTEAGIVVSFENKNHVYDWHPTHAADFAPKAEEWFPVYISLHIPVEMQQNDLLAVYLWNNKSRVYIDDIEIRWISGVN